MKSDAVVGLRKIYIALARFIQRRLSFTVGDSVSAFRVKLGVNDVNCVDVPLNSTHSLTHSLTHSVTLVHFAKIVGRNGMLFDRDTPVVPSNTVLDRGPVP